MQLDELIGGLEKEELLIIKDYMTVTKKKNTRKNTRRTIRYTI